MQLYNSRYFPFSSSSRSMTLPGFSTILVLLWSVKYSTSHHNERLLFDIYPGHVVNIPANMSNVIQMTTKVPDKMECAFFCIGVPWCLSINFNVSSAINDLHFCELLSTDEKTNREYMIRDKIFIHLSIKNPCENNPCLNNKVCSRKDYICQCKEGFTGTYCQNDINECDQSNSCHSNAKCENTVGSYRCVCDDGRYVGKGYSCNKCIERALGMESRAIPDSAITASSAWSGNDHGYNARLNNNPGHWAPTGNRVGEWLQVDFGKLTIATKVATQGRPFLPASYMNSYSLSYRGDNESWKTYVHASYGEILPGNTNYYGTVTNTLNPKITTRYIRIHPKTWYHAITIRVEFYGCFSP